MLGATLYFKSVRTQGEFTFDKQFKYFNIFYILKKIKTCQDQKRDETLSFGTWVRKTLSYKSF